MNIHILLINVFLDAFPNLFMNTFTSTPTNTFIVVPNSNVLSGLVARSARCGLKFAAAIEAFVQVSVKVIINKFGQVSRIHLLIIYVYTDLQNFTHYIFYKKYKIY